jgi:hypothetical protein
VTDPLVEVVRRLEAERYGPVVHDAERVPHLPLWLFDEQWRAQPLDDGLPLAPPPPKEDIAKIAAHRRRTELAQQREVRRRREVARHRSVRLLTEEEASRAV